MTEFEQPLPPLRTRLEPFLEDIGLTWTVDDVRLQEWRAALKAAGPFRGTERWRAAVQVVSSAPNKMPPRDIAERTVRVVKEWQTAKDRVRTLAQVSRHQACDLIRARRSETGEGPLWRELAAHFGVTEPADVRQFVWQLRKIGAVQFSHERGSLDVADPATAATEAGWSHAEWARVIREHMTHGSRRDTGGARPDHSRATRAESTHARTSDSETNTSAERS